MRTIRITLDFVLSDLPKDERKELAEQADCPLSELGRLSDITAHEFADLVAGHMENCNDEMWAGSDMYAKVEDVQVASSEYISKGGKP